MEFKRRIFVSCTADEFLDERRRRIKTSILKKVIDEGFEPQQFLVSGIPASMGWNFATVDEVMRRCRGAVVFAFPRFTGTIYDQEVGITTEYNHYEGALANTYKLPVLTIAEIGVADRGIAWSGGGNAILWTPRDADVDWLSSESFKHRFENWAALLRERYDAFLGYCSKSKNTAQAIQLFLSKKLKLDVMDWSLDFTAGGSILEEIERAARLCSCGIFLFTKDDDLQNAAGDRAAPRDNVVFETGYFMHAKGKNRVVIIREEGAKMPADIGGTIYIALEDKEKTAEIEEQLRYFLEKHL